MYVLDVLVVAIVLIGIGLGVATLVWLQRELRGPQLR
jgi:hypothetical protein